MKLTAIRFGVSLDNDNFETTKSLLSNNCKYVIGDNVLLGSDTICDSYKQNMLEGRKKLDKLVWGKSVIETINDSEYIVHFTDYLTHKGVSYIHRCKQHLKINRRKKIFFIEHISDLEEQKRLDDFYEKVGLS